MKVRRLKQTEIQKIGNDLARVPDHKVAEGCGRFAYLVENCQAGQRPGRGTCQWLSVDRLREDSLKRRAAFDLRCDAKSLQMTPLDPGTMGITGCGQQLTYLLRCPHDISLWSEQCTWVGNTESIVRSPAPVAPVAPAAPMAPVTPEAPPVAPETPPAASTAAPGG